jgi:UDP-glucose 4,6-dehydratase
MEDGQYKPKNILLTGGAGFIGSHVAIRLLQRYPDYKASRTTCG